MFLSHDEAQLSNIKLPREAPLPDELIQVTSSLVYHTEYYTVSSPSLNAFQGTIKVPSKSSLGDYRKTWKCPCVKVFCCCSVAKSCLTLYDSMDRSIPSFPVLHYLPEFAQTHVHWVTDVLEVCAVCYAVLSHFSPVRLFATQWAVARQGPLFMEFPRQEYWSGFPCPLQEIFPTQGWSLISYISCICRQVLSHHCHLGGPSYDTLSLIHTCMPYSGTITLMHKYAT